MDSDRVPVYIPTVSYRTYQYIALVSHIRLKNAIFASTPSERIRQQMCSIGQYSREYEVQVRVQVQYYTIAP